MICVSNMAMNPASYKQFHFGRAMYKRLLAPRGSQEDHDHILLKSLEIPRSRGQMNWAKAMEWMRRMGLIDCMEDKKFQVDG